MFIFGWGEMCMAKGDNAVEFEDAAEWIYDAVVSSHECNEIVRTIDMALESAFADEPLISEADIDETIENELGFWKDYYERGEMTKEEYEQACLESSDRELQKQELIEAGVGGGLEDAYAAAELLVSLLGSTSPVLNYAFEAYPLEFKSGFQLVSNKCDKANLRLLLPKALKVVEKLKTGDAIKLIGYYDKNDQEDWLNVVKALESSLKNAAFE